MHKKNEVIDLQNYRVAEEDEVKASEQTGPQHLPAGTTLLLGQYKITGYLNAGGFGITYRAHDSLGREVVIKECFPSEMAYRSGKLMGARTPRFKAELEAIVEHFVNEAHRLATARHDNIVHVHQIFEENDTAYMAMDHIDGQDLLDIVEIDPKRFSPREIEQLVHKMLHAIKYVHDRGMLHRDISPDNILIDQQGEPILIDFGSAREFAAQTHKSFSKLKFVKDGYSPQEFYISGSEQGTWSDLYSFAASMYHVITGAAPEDGQKRLAALAAKKPDPYEPLAGNVTGYPVRFLKAIDKALEILPDNRIRTADEWLELLSVRSVRTHSQGAPMPGVIEKLPAFDRLPISSLVARVFSRHGRALAAGTAVLAILGVVAGILALPGTEAGQSEDIALATPTPPQQAIMSDPRIALVDPADGGLPARERTVVSLDGVASGIAANRFPTPPLAPFEPTADSRPRIVAAPSLALPAPQVATPDMPGRVTPVVRVAGVLPLTSVETVSAPLVPLPDIVAAAPDVPAASAMPDSLSRNATQPASADVVALAEPNADIAPGVTDTALPLVAALQDIDGQMNAFAPAETDSSNLTVADTPDVARLSGLPALPVALSETLFSSDVTPPPPLDQTGSQALAQIAYAHWDVRMPFEAELARVRNANTAEITAVADDANLAVSGNWIEEGVILYSFNGERLQEDTPISVHVLQSLSIDPDGYARATVRYRNPTTGVLDRGLLAVPVIREIGLADGSVVEARMMDLIWVLEVTATGSDNGLQVGDILTGEVATGTMFTSPDALAEALTLLVERQAETARITVLRDGRRLEAEWRLVRK